MVNGNRPIESVLNRTAAFVRMTMQRGNFRILYGAATFVLALVLIILLTHVLTVKHIELVVDGESRKVKTQVNLVGELLTEQDITIGEHDAVSAPLTASLKDHPRIEVRYAHPVTVYADGQKREIWTAARTVEEVLKQANVALGELDRVNRGLADSVQSGDEIRVTRVDKKLETESKAIPFSVVKRHDPTLAKGKEKVLQRGQPGYLQETYERIYEDGKLVSETLLASETTQLSTDEIVAIGSKSEVAILSAASPDVQTVTKDGITFGAKRVIEATLTAYYAGVQSTGKSEDHPQYGITYTGTTVTEGRTVAVDPDVIPFGWWIYIEGYGFRRAEDKGSGVRGNWVDIYFDSLEAAESFGKKKGTVYVIGPEHPQG